MREKLLSIIFIFLFFIASLSFSIAQPGNGGGAPHPCPPNNPNCAPARVPITETIFILLAGGIGFGIKSVSKRRKKY